VAIVRSNFRGRSPTRRKTSWIQGPGDATIIVMSGSSTLGFGSSVGLFDGETVIRVRGSLQAFLTSVTAAGDGYHVAVGIGVFTSEAFAAGIASLPSPISDMDWNGWLYHRFYDLHGAAAGSPEADVSTSIQFEVDSKAMRKVNDGVTIGCLVQGVELGDSVMGVYFQSRLLMKLP